MLKVVINRNRHLRLRNVGLGQKHSLYLEALVGELSYSAKFSTVASPQLAKLLTLGIFQEVYFSSKCQ
jgi:hypothetical protein